MVLNSYGAVVLNDGTVPRSKTGKANTTISGGDPIVVSPNVTDGVGSHADSVNTSDIIVDIINGSDRINGVALHNAGSNENVAFITRGDILVRTAGAGMSGGQGVYPVSGTNPGFAEVATDAAYSGTQAGRCIVPNSSGTNNYSLISLNV